ncbi:hypothetical protein [Aurantiacibacter sp. MUD61]|uniref:hypothetical protein n=1 Tax=Aurantiacibacter sp. MUD61 TaxID=3009083 RepID=UPI0022F03B38|nr:hypothetical protein [Aurantiacibacter sp. MUD61]
MSADPTYETVRLNGGFTPDPYTIPIMSGGQTNARDLGNGCRGYIATRPDVRLHFEAGTLPLILSATSDSDTTLVVNAPNGSWYCDDDSGDGLDPMLRFDPAMSGRYEIWVGNYGEAANYEAQIHISELSSGGGSGTTTRPITRPQSGGSDAIYETVRLSAGFAPDPYTVRLSSGGSRDASQIASGCRGYIASSPDVNLDYTSGTFPLYLSVDSMADTTLVIRAPNGSYYCDDDSGEGLNPSVRFETPLSGRYQIWVGTYGSTDMESAELNISELYSE